MQNCRVEIRFLFLASFDSFVASQHGWMGESSGRCCFGFKEEGGQINVLHETLSEQAGRPTIEVPHALSCLGSKVEGGQAEGKIFKKNKYSRSPENASQKHPEGGEVPSHDHSSIQQTAELWVTLYIKPCKMLLNILQYKIMLVITALLTHY